MFVFTKRIIFSLLIASVILEIGDFAETKEEDGYIGRFINYIEGMGSSMACSAYKFVYPFFRFSTSDLTFLLFTRSNPKDQCNLAPNKEALQKCKFDSSKPTKVIIHGFIEGFVKEDKLLFVMKDKLLEKGDYNVVVLNYTTYTHFMFPPLSSLAANSLGATIIGVRVASWIDFLRKQTGAKPERFHLISTSMGTIVASYAGKFTCTIGRITFMDGQGVYTRFFPEFLRQSHTDALYTEAIHTNGAYFITGGFGLKRPYADIDYYPNGGSRQPLCEQNQTRYDELFNKTGSFTEAYDCDHYSPYFYYLASFRKDCHFNGLICDSYDDYNNGKCNSGNADECEMFSDSKIKLDLPPYSRCYLNTSAKYPFCLN